MLTINPLKIRAGMSPLKTRLENVSGVYGLNQPPSHLGIGRGVIEHSLKSPDLKKGKPTTISQERSCMVIADDHSNSHHRSVVILLEVIGCRGLDGWY